MKTDSLQPAASAEAQDSETAQREGDSRAASCSASGRDQYNDLKLEINRLIWQYAPGETTLGTADEMACKILTSILAGKYLI